MAALAGDASVAATHLPAARGGPGPVPVAVILPEGTDQLLPWLELRLFLGRGVIEVSLEPSRGYWAWVDPKEDCVC